MSTVSLSVAERKKLEREQRLIERAAKEAISKTTHKRKSLGWTRKSFAIDDDVLAAMEAVCERDRKLFSQLVRDLLIEGLRSRGIEI
jgi:hypothetical protein